jgi:16S rRNA C1402 N4-methylase RsmH
MRMSSKGNLESVNESNSITAEAIVNNFPVHELTRIISKYGQERQAKKIAASIEKARNKITITSTTQLAQIVASGLGMGNAWYYSKSHPATKTFQALRINDELNALYNGLVASEHLLKPKGKLVVVTFHSLEDRLVKNFSKECINSLVEYTSIEEKIKPDQAKYRRMRREAHLANEKCEQTIWGEDTIGQEPDDIMNHKSRKQIEGSIRSLIKKVVRPIEDEIMCTPRSRSAKLRVLERTSASPVHKLFE